MFIPTKIAPKEKTKIMTSYVELRFRTVYFNLSVPKLNTKLENDVFECNPYS